MRFRMIRYMTIVALASGCGNREPGNIPSREYLESGTERVTYESLPPLRWTCDTVADWDIWDPEGDYIFSQVSDAVGGMGSFFLLDGGNTTVVELAPDGSLLNSFGRQGSGPGELRYPLFMSIHDGLLWISDVGNRRFSLYDLGGTYVRDVKWPGASRLVNDFVVTIQGRILHGGMWPLTVAELADQEPIYYLVLFPAEGEWEEGGIDVNVDTLATMNSLPYMSTEIRSEEGDVRMWFGHPELAPRLLWSAGDGFIVTVTSEMYRFEVREPDGEVILELVAPTPDLKVTEAHKEWFFHHEAERRLREYGDFTLTSDSRARIPFARKMPAINCIAVDIKGRIWVEANRPEPGVTRLDIFERDGVYLGYLETIRMPAAFSGSEYVLIRENSDDALDRFRVGIVSSTPPEDSGIR